MQHYFLSLWVDKPPRYVISHPGQLSLAIPLWVGTVIVNDSLRISGTPCEWRGTHYTLAGLGMPVSLAELRTTKRRSVLPYGPTRKYFTSFRMRIWQTAIASGSLCLFSVFLSNEWLTKMSLNDWSMLIIAVKIEFGNTNCKKHNKTMLKIYRM